MLLHLLPNFTTGYETIWKLYETEAPTFVEVTHLNLILKTYIKRSANFVNTFSLNNVFSEKQSCNPRHPCLKDEISTFLQIVLMKMKLFHKLKFTKFTLN